MDINYKIINNYKINFQHIIILYSDKSQVKDSQAESSLDEFYKMLIL